MLALIISFLADSGFDVVNMKALVPAYGGLLLEAFSSSALEHTQGVLVSNLGQTMTSTLGVIGAFIFSLIFHAARQILVSSIEVLHLDTLVLTDRRSSLLHIHRCHHGIYPWYLYWHSLCLCSLRSSRL